MTAVLLGAAYRGQLPPRARVLSPLGRAETAVRGTMHVHTRRSDGTGSVADVAAAAARAGLNFVIITDHGDGTRMPDPPAYEQGVLIIDAVEISTTGGHVVAIGLPQAPYPLAGEPRDVVEDVVRLGGFAIAAHPDSPKPALRWSGWDADGVGGLEWLNADSAWRDESRWMLARALLAYPARGREAVAMLFDRPETTLARWDGLTRGRKVVGVAVPDAHARLGLNGFGEPYDTGLALRIPSYETMFTTMTLALTEATLTGDAATDAGVVLSAIRNGHVHSVLDALGGPAAMAFTMRSGDVTAGEGDILPVNGPVLLRVVTHAPPDAVVAIVKDGTVIRTSEESPFEETMANAPAVYRVEVHLPGAPGEPPVPWIVSNPIYVGRASAGAPRGEAPPSAPPLVAAPEGLDTSRGQVERSENSSAALDVIGTGRARQLLFRYALGGRLSTSPYAAVVFPTRMPAGQGRLAFTAHASHPMRLAVQFRAPSGSGDRWSRSVYLDQTPRGVSIPFAEMRPVGTTASATPELGQIDSLLFVVDTLNTALGTNGLVWLENLRFEK